MVLPDLTRLVALFGRVSTYYFRPALLESLTLQRRKGLHPQRIMRRYSPLIGLHRLKHEDLHFQCERVLPKMEYGGTG
jgi:hypothetical protein